MKQSGIFYTRKQHGNSMEIFRKQQKDEGKLTKKSLLSGIIPEDWRESVYERDDFWAIHVERNEIINDFNFEIRQREFKEFINELKDSLGASNIEKIDALDKAGSYFIVYLRKDANDTWSEKDQKDLDDLYKKYDL